jgi:hypothetical protein
VLFAVADNATADVRRLSGLRNETPRETDAVVNHDGILFSGPPMRAGNTKHA